ncbi:MAG TPA: hypothetical protein VHW23_24675, partial [Kofleriaceae bacterium]|nr:hypothetical protein [Kofleriaceae bacterium]
GSIAAVSAIAVATPLVIAHVRHDKSLACDDRQDRDECDQHDRRDPHHLADERRKQPGTHRAGPAERALIDRVARGESAKLLARRQTALASVPSTTWVSLGPTSALNEFNFVDIAGVDSGRLNTILVDPRDPNVVYIAASGGGVWKTFDFLSAAGPTWSPATDTLPNLAVGALAMDPGHPDTLYLGNGDFVDGSGNTILKSVDGGSTWGPPVALANRPLPGGFEIGVGAIRTLAVHGPQVLAGTDVGLYASNDGGATFALIDLPNADGGLLTESIWSIVATGDGHWVASGVHGCAPSSGPPPIAQGVDPGRTDASGQVCQHGANGEIWISSDGTHWTPARIPNTIGIGRLTLAASKAISPASTVVYAYVGSTDGFQTLGFWRSHDGGATWLDASGSLASPTLAPPMSAPNCAGLDLGHDQTWYNQAIVVDPTNPDHVVAGGNLCGARTLDGTSPSPTWELISHWLPNADFGATARGMLPYVHADWHTATSVVIDGKVQTFVGGDGGVFTSTDLFTTARGEQVTWIHHNTGLVTHLIYALGSGDPATGDPFVLFAGLQDNGTRYRANPGAPSVFNQPIGGDGIGATVHHASSGTTYWGSVEFAHAFCRPSPTVDCASGENWQGVDPTLDPDPEPRRRGPARSQRVVTDGDGPAREDQEPFFIHYADVETDTTGPSVLTHSNGQVFVSVDDGKGGLAWQPISQDLTPQNLGFASVTASRTIPGLYGAAGLVSLAPFYITTAGNTMTTWIAAQPVTPTGFPTVRLTGASSIDFPPVTPVGKTPGQVFIGAFSSIMNNGLPPPDDKGRLWRTTDGGQTWTSIVGADPAHRLPNVAVYVVKYDPVTPTTIYAGTDLGVYLSTDDAATWNRMGEGFPMVPARDLYVAKNQDFIRVATFGRGLWEIYPSAAANQGSPGNGDFDRNLRLDWIDLGAMAARLGTTPTGATAPLYTWIMDITDSTDAPTQKIDDADLDALLSHFGGHP